MYKTEGVDIIASVAKRRTDTADLVSALEHVVRFIGIQRNNKPVAVLLSRD